MKIFLHIFLCTAAIFLGASPCIISMAHASSDPAFVAFAKNTKEIAIGYIHLKSDKTLPLSKEEIIELLTKTVKEDFANVIGMKVLTQNEYDQIMLDEKQPLRDDILQINLLLYGYEGATLSPDISEQVMVLNFAFAKAEKSTPFVSTKILPTIVEEKPLLFVAENGKEEFKRQLQNILFHRLQQKMVPIICFDTPANPEGCSKIAAPPSKSKNGVTPAQ